MKLQVGESVGWVRSICIKLPGSISRRTFGKGYSKKKGVNYRYLTNEFEVLTYSGRKNFFCEGLNMKNLCWAMRSEYYPECVVNIIMGSVTFPSTLMSVCWH